jgi:hypothetical protein
MGEIQVFAQIPRSPIMSNLSQWIEDKLIELVGFAEPNVVRFSVAVGIFSIFSLLL